MVKKVLNSKISSKKEKGVKINKQIDKELANCQIKLKKNQIQAQTFSADWQKRQLRSNLNKKIKCAEGYNDILRDGITNLEEQHQHQLFTNEDYQIDQRQQEMNQFELNVTNHDEYENKNQSLQTIQKYELIGEIKQMKNCLSIDMNKDETILINSNQQEIQLQNLNSGRLELKERLQSCQNCVSCVCFSKKSNWFISGGHDFFIIIWEQQENKSWKQIQELPALEEKYYCFQYDIINHIILSEDENEFISASFFSKIKIWIKKQKQWICNQILQIDTRSVYFLSYSSNCQIFGSVGVEALRIWTKTQNQWCLKQTCERVEFGKYHRLCFIKDNELIATSKIPGVLVVFIQQKDMLQAKQRLFLSEAMDEEQEENFPIIYNKKTNSVVVRHNLQIFIIDRKINGLYAIRQVIDGDYRTGYVIQNGDCLIMSKYQDLITKKKQKKSKKKEISLQIWILK